MTPQCGRSVVQFLVVGGDILYETKVNHFMNNFVRVSYIYQIITITTMSKTMCRYIN